MLLRRETSKQFAQKEEPIPVLANCRTLPDEKASDALSIAVATIRHPFALRPILVQRSTLTRVNVIGPCTNKRLAKNELGATPKISSWS
jgi:hypothetical protein